VRVLTAHNANKIINYVPLGDQTLVVQFENILSIEVSRTVQSFAHIIEQQGIPGVTEMIITFNTLAVCYDPIKITYDKLLGKLQALQENNLQSEDIAGKKVYVPVVFGGEYGPDLEDLSKQVGLTPEEVKQRLYSKPYYVYMVGFIAGSPYGGEIDEQLILPRRSSPRVKVRKGSVAIANKQTTIYTIDAPGGWHLLGWTPMEIFNPYREPPGLLLSGDYLQYIPITADEAERWDRHRQREWDQEWNSFM
jgi:inhibitor of KinA